MTLYKHVEFSKWNKLSFMKWYYIYVMYSIGGNETNNFSTSLLSVLFFCRAVGIIRSNAAMSAQPTFRRHHYQLSGLFQDQRLDNKR